MVLSALRAQTNRLTTRIAWVLEALHLTPNAVTLIALAITSVGAWRIATGHFVDGAAIAGLGSVLDAFDGALARRLDRVTPFGGYLDSLLDRVADGILFLAVGYAYDEAWVWAVCFAAFITAASTSYAKARVYQDARPPSDAFHDLVERPERLLLLLFGVGIQGLVWSAGGTLDYVPWLVTGLAALGGLTVFQRALRAKRFLEEAVRDG